MKAIALVLLAAFLFALVEYRRRRAFALASTRLARHSALTAALLVVAIAVGMWAGIAVIGAAL